MKKLLDENVKIYIINENSTLNEMNLISGVRMYSNILYDDTDNNYKWDYICDKGVVVVKKHPYYYNLSTHHRNTQKSEEDPDKYKTIIPTVLDQCYCSELCLNEIPSERINFSIPEFVKKLVLNDCTGNIKTSYFRNVETLELKNCNIPLSFIDIIRVKTLILTHCYSYSDNSDTNSIENRNSNSNTSVNDRLENLIIHDSNMSSFKILKSLKSLKV